MPRRREPSLTPQTILWLQTTSGNRAVQRLLARRTAVKAMEQRSLAGAAEEKHARIPLEPDPPTKRAKRACWQAVITRYRKRRQD